MDFLQSLDPQILVAAAVALVAIVVGGAFFLFSSNKPKGLNLAARFFFFPSLSWLVLYFSVTL